MAPVEQERAMSNETPHDKLQDERIINLKDRIEDLENAKLTTRVSNIETSMKWGKWTVTVLIAWAVGRFVMQTDAGFDEMKDEMTKLRDQHHEEMKDASDDYKRHTDKFDQFAREIRSDIKKITSKQTELAIAFANEKKKKPKSIKDLYDMLTSEEETVSLEWETEEELYEVIKRDMDEKDAKKLENIQQAK